MFQHSETISKIMQAMLMVQGAVDGVAKDAMNPHFKRPYASLESVVDAIRAPCQKAGLVVMQAPGEIVDGAISITTMLAHAESGEWVRSTMQVPLSKADPQGAGSALTYGERYSLMAMFNLPPVDDDGEAAAVRGPQPLAREPVPPRAADRPITGQMPSQGGNAERVAKMLDTIAASMAGELDKLIVSSRFVAAYDSLSASEKATVDRAVENQRRRLNGALVAPLDAEVNILRAG